jgi:hypothetical protein
VHIAIGADRGFVRRAQRVPQDIDESGALPVTKATPGKGARGSGVAALQCAPLCNPQELQMSIQQRSSLIAAALAAAALSLPAYAQTAPAMGSGDAAAAERSALEAAFKQADKDGDGKLSKAEVGAVKGWPEKLAKADTDKDGMISMSEFMAAHSAK